MTLVCIRLGSCTRYVSYDFHFIKSSLPQAGKPLSTYFFFFFRVHLSAKYKSFELFFWQIYDCQNVFSVTTSKYCWNISIIRNIVQTQKVVVKVVNLIFHVKNMASYDRNYGSAWLMRKLVSHLSTHYSVFHVKFQGQKFLSHPIYGIDVCISTFWDRSLHGIFIFKTSQKHMILWGCKWASYLYWCY